MPRKKEGLSRVGLRVPEVVKEWYVKESNDLGLTMSQYMTLILVNFKRQQENVEMMRTLSEISKNPEFKQMNQQAIEMFDFIKLNPGQISEQINKHDKLTKKSKDSLKNESEGLQNEE